MNDTYFPSPALGLRVPIVRWINVAAMFDTVECNIVNESVSPGTVTILYRLIIKYVCSRTRPSRFDDVAGRQFELRVIVMSVIFAPDTNSV